MRFNKRQQQILFSKPHPWKNYTKCVAYVTPVEIVYLVSIGCKPEDARTVETAKLQIAIGEIYGGWFYFTPTAELLDKMRDRFPLWQRHNVP